MIYVESVDARFSAGMPPKAKDLRKAITLDSERRLCILNINRSLRGKERGPKAE